jgi:hypothetical protein
MSFFQVIRYWLKAGISIEEHASDEAINAYISPFMILFAHLLTTANICRLVKVIRTGLYKVRLLIKVPLQDKV